MRTLATELAFYGAYHSNFANQIVHLIFVPLILWSAFILLGLIHRSLAFALWIAYSLFFLSLDPAVGMFASCFYFLVWYSADVIVRRTEKQGPKAVPSISKKQAIFLGCFAQVLSWTIQVFVGHYIFEGTKPTLLDSITQAFSLAPFFVIYEALWMIIPGFRADVKLEVQKHIAIIHSQWGK